MSETIGEYTLLKPLTNVNAGNCRWGFGVCDDEEYFIKPPTDQDSVMADQVYMAPEVFLLICNEEGAIGSPADVFSLALCMHSIVAGEPPRQGKYRYAYQAVLDGGELGLSRRIPEWLRVILPQMLQANPEDRPKMENVFLAIKHANPAELNMPVVTRKDKGPTTGGTLKTPKVEDAAKKPFKGDSRLWGGSPEKEKYQVKQVSEGEKPLPTNVDHWFSAPGEL